MSWVTRTAKGAIEIAKCVAGFPDPEKFPAKANNQVWAYVNRFKEQVEIWQDLAEQRNLNGAENNTETVERQFRDIERQWKLLEQDFDNKPKTYEVLKSLWPQRVFFAGKIKDVIIANEPEKNNPKKLHYLLEAFQNLQAAAEKFTKNTVPQKAHIDSSPKSSPEERRR